MLKPTGSTQDRRLFAIGIVLTTYIFFALCDTAAKWMVLSGIPPLQVAFGRYIVQFAFMLGLALPESGLGAFRSSRGLALTVRGFLLLGMTALNFTSLLYLPLTLTATIMFTIPLMITALSVPMLGEKVGWRRWVAILVGFAGIIVIVQPWGAQFHWAVFLSLACSFSGALYYIMTRKLAGKESALTMQLYVGAVGAIALLPFVITSWVWPDSIFMWIVFLSVGVAAMTGHQIAITAHRYAPASVLAPFGYTQIVWMALSSWLIFAEPPDMWMFVGTPIVAASGLYIWLRERELAKSVAMRASPSATDQVLAEEPGK
ncbi:DMT family transporter [Pelagibacterium sediminicola]|uniref:DMT family transporter n=1 Tax=Pelagibacterium sediminicola TaxID=2248761 RepID=UPI000E31374C|nr:DMT family transporter [Pelagibacterium sediminicola]